MRGFVMAAMISAAALAGCQRGPNVEEMADTALEQANLGDKVNANYDRDAKVVHLTGTVDANTDRDRANDVVRASIGNLAEVANEIVVEGKEEKIADDFDGSIKERFDTLREESEQLRDFEVNVAVENGVVTMTGEVANAAQRTRFEEMVRGVPGVKDVVNSITIDPKAGPRRPTAR
jgi:osmotically-inducible protein OsmY